MYIKSKGPRIENILLRRQKKKKKTKGGVPPCIMTHYKVTVIKQLKWNSMHLVVIKAVLSRNELTNETKQKIEYELYP